MTLIVTAINKDMVCCATDKRLTDGNFDVTSEDTVKSKRIICKSDDFMLSFCGQAYIEDIPPEQNFDLTVVNWVQDQLNKIDLADKSADEVIEHIRKILEENFRQHRFPHNVSPLILIAAGWKGERKLRNPFVSKITNIHRSNTSNPNFAGLDFRIEPIKLSNKGTQLIIDGYIPATSSNEFTNAKQYIKDFLLKQPGDHVRIIRDKIMELILISSRDPESKNTIGEKITAAIITSGGGGMNVKIHPNEDSYTLPGYSTPNMKVSGLKVTGDWLEEGDIIVGG